jgi:LacI family transcriptional regulator
LNLPGVAENLEKLRGLAKQGHPMVELWGRRLSDAGVPYVDVNHRATGRRAVAHLLELGHRRIVHLTHEHYQVAQGKTFGEHFDALEFAGGYSEAMREAGLEPQIATHRLDLSLHPYTPQFYSGGQAAAADMLSRDPRPTAVVCYNDNQAWGVLHACQGEGVSVPNDLSLIGYGGWIGDFVGDFSLTTFAAPSNAIGQFAAKMLMSQLAGESVSAELFEPELQVRTSTAAPRLQSGRSRPSKTDR